MKVIVNAILFLTSLFLTRKMFVVKKFTLWITLDVFQKVCRTDETIVIQESGVNF